MCPSVGRYVCQSQIFLIAVTQSLREREVERKLLKRCDFFCYNSVTLGHNFVDYVKMPMSNDETRGKVKGIRAKKNAKNTC